MSQLTSSIKGSTARVAWAKHALASAPVRASSNAVHRKVVGRTAAQVLHSCKALIDAGHFSGELSPLMREAKLRLSEARNTTEFDFTVANPSYWKEVVVVGVKHGPADILVPDNSAPEKVALFLRRDDQKHLQIQVGECGSSRLALEKADALAAMYGWSVFDNSPSDELFSV